MNPCVSTWRRLLAVLAMLTCSLATTAPAQADPVSLQTGRADVGFLQFDDDGDLSAFDMRVDTVLGLSPDGEARLSFGFGFSLAAPGASPSGGLTVFDDSGLLLGGDLTMLAGAPNRIEFTLDRLDGHAAMLFGGSVSGVIEFVPFLGADPFAALVDGETYAAVVRLTGTATALHSPGAAGLVLAGLLALVAMGCTSRRQRHSPKAWLA